MILPAHPHPLTDELLSSWMIRLAVSNGWHAHTFYSKILGYQRPIWNRDIDKFVHSDLVFMLHETTGIGIEGIRRMNLQCFNGEIFNSSGGGANLPWVLPLGIYHREHHHAGLQVCPQCLKDDSSPYYRKHWRLSFCCTCPKHKCFLIDHCPFCGALIEFHRLAIGSKNEASPPLRISLCHLCSRDLSCVVSESTETNALLGAGMYSKFMDGYLNNVWDPCLPTCLCFFQGLRTLIKGILSRYSTKLMHQYSELNGVESIKIRPKWTIDHYNVQERYYLMCLVFWLISDWPKNFQTLAAKGFLRRSAFSEAILPSPFWIRSEIEAELPCGNVMPSRSELLNILKYIENKYGYLSVTRIKSTLGISTDIANSYLYKLTRKYSIKIYKQRIGYKYGLKNY